MDRNNQSIGFLYELIFPYGIYANDKVDACLKINKELKNLCSEDMKYLLIIIYKSIAYKSNKIDIIDITPDTPAWKICETLQNYLYNICLSTDEVDRRQIFLGLKGAPPDLLKPTDKELCGHLSKIYNKT